MLKPSVEILGRPREENINQLLGYKAVNDAGEPIGHVKDYVFDENRKLRYLVIDTGFWIFGKKVLFPVGLSQVREEAQEVILNGLTRDTAEELPAYQPGESISSGFEEDVFRRFAPGSAEVSYEEVEAFQAPIQMRLLEERLLIDKHAEKVADIKVRKIVETHIETIEIPVTVERLVIETSEGVEVVANKGKQARDEQDENPGALREEVINIQAYREVVEVSKRKAVAEEVNIRKISETVTETVETDLRKEELYIDDPTLGRS